MNDTKVRTVNKEWQKEHVEIHGNLEFSKLDKFPRRKIYKNIDSFKKRIISILNIKGRKGQIEEIFTAKKYKGLRVNPLLVKTAEDIIKIKDDLFKSGVDAIPLRWYLDAFIVPSKDIPLIMDLPMVKEGLVFVQNPSSYLPILALEPKFGEKYLDVCSAPGGKAALYAGLSRGKSDLYLVDDNSFRVNKKMKPILNEQRVEPKEIIICDARTLLEDGKVNPESFEKVLADVDCSSEGLINFESKRPLQTWLFKTPEQFASLQLKILIVAYRALKPGGIVVYSTCTLAPEENEGTISRFLQKTPEAILQQLEFEGEKTLDTITNWPKLKINKELEKSLRIHPDSEYMEGFFLCRIYKPLPEDDSAEGQENKRKNKQARLEKISLDTLAKEYCLSKLKT